jgi:hypothetical protein
MPKGMGKGSKATQFRALEKTLFERFHESYIPEPNSGCWIWEKGHGRITANGKMHLAHKISYLLCYGISRNFVLRRCGNSCCVNPEHLYGADHKSAKLTEADVRAIRADTRSQRIIASTFGVSQAQVNRIKMRKRWEHLDG